MRRPLVTLVFALLVSVPNLFAWGGEGHKIIAAIADKRLTPAARMQVIALLEGTPLPDVASWADDVRKERPETSRWHYVDIPYEATSYDAARDCELTDHGDCVIAEIVRAEKMLGDTSQSKADRTEALKFLIHFLGDMHQPLHCAERRDPVTGKGDRGGNDVHLSFFGTPTNLHAVWESGLIERGGVNVDRVEKWLVTQDEKALVQGDLVRWAMAAHDLAKSNSYVIPEDHQLGEGYVEKNVLTVVQQLGSAGVRLANILNSLLGRLPEAPQKRIQTGFSNLDRLVGPEVPLSKGEIANMRILCATVLLVFLGISAQAQTGTTQQPFTITISAENPIVKIGSPVRIKVRLTNTSTQDISIGGGIDRGLRSTYTYEIRDTNGNLAPKKTSKTSEATTAGKEIDTATVVLASLKPGETSFEAAELSFPFDMSQPGKYTIQLARSIPGDKTHGQVKSNAITVTVAP